MVTYAKYQSAKSRKHTILHIEKHKKIACVENRILRGRLEMTAKGCPCENKFIKCHGSKATWTSFPTLSHVQEFLQGLS